MEEVEIVATFDSEDSADVVSRAINTWFAWLMEGDTDDIPEIFEDLGLATEDYIYDRDSDLDWEDTPRAWVAGNTVHVGLTSEGGESVGVIEEVLEALGAYEVMDANDIEDDEE